MDKASYKHHSMVTFFGQIFILVHLRIVMTKFLSAENCNGQLCKLSSAELLDSFGLLVNGSAIKICLQEFVILVFSQNMRDCEQVLVK